MANKWMNALQIASVYIGTVVGAGFATGREIIEFFSKYGESGLIGIICSAFLFSWLGTKVMMIGKKTEASSYSQLNQYLFGRMASYFVNILMFIMLFGITSVMISGAGAIFEEQLGFSKQLGIFFTMGLSFIVVLFGVKGLASVNLFVVPIFVLFSLILFAGTMASGHLPGFSVQELLAPVKSSFLYVAFNLALAQAVLVPLANEIQDENSIKLGGWLGGIGLSLMLFFGYFSLLHFPRSEQFEIPMAELIKQLFAGIYYIYILVIFGEVISSVIGNLYGLERQLPTRKAKLRIMFVLLMIISAYFISLIGYGRLIATLYPLFGYMSIVFLILLMFKKVPDNKSS